MYILLAGLSHKTAPVEMREKMALTGSSLEAAYQRLKNCPALEGVVILSTCNRTEIYASTRNIDEGSRVLAEYFKEKLQVDDSVLASVVYQPNCYDAIAHLFRVASGLDSMVLGETQILGQVKEAYMTAIENGASDGVLNTLFQKAIYVGKKVRAETGLDRSAVSISYAAVEMAKKVIGDLSGKSVLIVGAGKMSELAVQYLVANGVDTVVVSNRSYDRAVCLADRVKGRAVHFDVLYEEIARADIVISCTAASHYVIRKDKLAARLAGRKTPLLMIDIAVPRDIEPGVADLPGVHLCDIDDLQTVVDLNLMERRRAATRAEKIIAEELEEFNNWLSTLYVIPVVKALKQFGEQIKEAELKRAFNRLGTVSPREEKVIRSLASSIVNQLLHFPVVNLKEIAATNQGHLYAEVLKKLFELQVEGDGDQSDKANSGGVQGQ